MTKKSKNHLWPPFQGQFWPILDPKFPPKCNKPLFLVPNHGFSSILSKYITLESRKHLKVPQNRPKTSFLVYFMYIRSHNYPHILQKSCKFTSKNVFQYPYMPLLTSYNDRKTFRNIYKHIGQFIPKSQKWAKWA